MIAILVSSFREGPPFLSTLRSAIAARPDYVLVVEAPLGDNPPAGDETPLEEASELADEAEGAGVLVDIRTPSGYADDAEKRSTMLRWTKTRANELGKADDDPLWVLWLDGDELLVFGEYLRDMTYRAAFETGAGGFPLRIVELDGSVAVTYGKVIRAEAVTRYLHSSYQVELANGLVVALPNVKVCSAGGIPFMTPEAKAELMTHQDEIMAVHRPPLAGEPHLLHRSLLRSPERVVERQSDAESRWFSEILGPDGKTIREVPR